MCKLTRFAFLLFVLSLPVFGKEIIQSEAWGPVSLQLWEHWQPSWNAEVQPHAQEFRIARGWNDAGKPFLRFFYFKPEVGLRAKIKGRVLMRTGDYSDAERDIPEKTIVGSGLGDFVSFEYLGDDFVDVTGKQI